METFEILGQIRVVVKLAPSLEKFSDPTGKKGNELGIHILEYLNDLLVDLTIPLAVSLSVSSGDDRDDFAFTLFQVYVNDQKCRLQPRILESRDIQAIELARSVARAFYENRELILTVPLSEKIRENWLTKYQKDILANVPIAEFHEFLLELVRRGLAINRLLINGVEMESEWNSAKIIEEGIFKSNVAAINVLLSKAQHNQILSNNEVKPRTRILDEPFEKKLSLVREGLFYELGIVLPDVGVNTESHLKSGEFRIQINDLRFPPIAGLDQDHLIVNDSSERLCLLGLTGKKIKNPVNETEFAIVENSDGVIEICEEAGLTVWDPGSFIALVLSAEIRRNASTLLTTETVTSLLGKIELVFPRLLKAALKYFSILELTWILRELLDEGFSIRDLRSILEALISIKVAKEFERSNYSLSILETVSLLRQALKEYVSKKYQTRENTLVVFLLDQQIETRISSNDDLSSEEHDKLIGSILEEVGILTTAQNPIILTTKDVRRKLRKLIEKEFPRFRILSYGEIGPNFNIQPIGRIRMH